MISLRDSILINCLSKSNGNLNFIQSIESALPHCCAVRIAAPKIASIVGRVSYPAIDPIFSFVGNGIPTYRVSGSINEEFYSSSKKAKILTGGRQVVF
jgi:hypothetical protein